MDSQHEVTRATGRELPEQTRERPLAAPAVDIYENGDEILLVADVPVMPCMAKNSTSLLAVALFGTGLTTTVRR